MIRNGSVTAETVEDVIRRFASSRDQALRQNFRGRCDLDDPHGKFPGRFADRLARNVRHHHDATREVAGYIQRNAIMQPMRLPPQRERPVGEAGFRHGLMILISRIGGARNNPPHETEASIARQRGLRQTEHGIFAGAAGADDEYKHLDAPLTGRTLTLACARINPSGA